MKKLIVCVIALCLCLAISAAFAEDHSTHVFDKGEVTLEATCVTPGTEIRACTICGHIEEREIAATDKHTPGEMDPMDALLVLQYYAGVINGVPNLVAADFNGDGSVDPMDALGILRYYAAQ